MPSRLAHSSATDILLYYVVAKNVGEYYIAHTFMPRRRTYQMPDNLAVRVRMEICFSANDLLERDVVVNLAADSQNKGVLFVD